MRGCSLMWYERMKPCFIPLIHRRDSLLFICVCACTCKSHVSHMQVTCRQTILILFPEKCCISWEEFADKWHFPRCWRAERSRHWCARATRAFAYLRTHTQFSPHAHTEFSPYAHTQFDRCTRIEGTGGRVQMQPIHLHLESERWPSSGTSRTFDKRHLFVYVSLSRSLCLGLFGYVSCSRGHSTKDTFIPKHL